MDNEGYVLPQLVTNFSTFCETRGIYCRVSKAFKVFLTTVKMWAKTSTETLVSTSM